MTPKEALEYLVIPLRVSGLTVELTKIDEEDLIIIRNHEGVMVGSIPLYGNNQDDID
jgi:hypothetical protein